jgi:energy-coupling factor transporter ATP-binding protein EcfA2
MPYIKSFRIEGLAGRDGVTARILNKDVNVFFGPNGSGKTSLLRILHSALIHKADLLKEVPFNSSEIVICSWANEEYKYQIDKSLFEVAQRAKPGARFLTSGRSHPEWQITPSDDTPWLHAYLPIARLYEGSTSAELGIFGTRDDSEMGLEARFASNLLATWKDYTRRHSQNLNKIQEEGLARILERVLSRTEPSTTNQFTDSSTAYEAVSTFLARRGVHKITPSSDEFSKRYSREPQFRGLVRDIEEVEKKIAAANAPIKALAQLIREMFIGGKDLSLKDDAIEVAIAGKELSLSMLSSGEKQLLMILVATVNASASVILIDEPELSMHVDWQRRLIPSMRLLNPSAQLIVATHSPEIMAEIPDNRVFQI